MKSALSTILSFLRRAHFLHGFLMVLLLFNFIGVAAFSIIVSADGREAMILIGAPHTYFLISLAVALGMGCLWDGMMAQHTQWRKRDEEQSAELAAATVRLESLRAFYESSPDFLSAEILKLGKPDIILFRVKAAPHGHFWPSDWDGTRVTVIVVPCDRWEHFSKRDKAQG
jgi:hypothetical protein